MLGRSLPASTDGRVCGGSAVWYGTLGRLLVLGALCRALRSGAGYKAYGSGARRCEAAGALWRLLGLALRPGLAARGGHSCENLHDAPRWQRPFL